ncbi:MAG: hypothetical protein IJ893_08935 [Bacteroidales bacterium]|nr:hypothetical protein [Bacteroidales bacterium]
MKLFVEYFLEGLVLECSRSDQADDVQSGGTDKKDHYRHKRDPWFFIIKTKIKNGKDNYQDVNSQSAYIVR